MSLLCYGCGTQCPKSVTAGDAALQMNKDMHIDAHQNKVCADTTPTFYHDAFFSSNDIIINALVSIIVCRHDYQGVPFPFSHRLRFESSELFV
jgi:hypothetical protein